MSDLLNRIDMRFDLVGEKLGQHIITDSGCWEFQGAKNDWGYGSFVIYVNSFTPHKRRFAAHRVSYAYHTGTDPKELCVCHTCDNPACINPDHLFLGTHKDNTADMLAKGRQAKMAGERNPRAQITRDTVERVVADIVAGKSNREIADQLPIGHAQVSLIRLGKSWKNVLKELGYEPDKHRRFSRAS